METCDPLLQGDRPIQGSVVDAFTAAYVRSGRPISVHIDLTYRCDLACLHCYLDDRTTWPEMTTREWKDVLQQLTELGVWRIGWSGGEVTLRPDFLELVAHAAKLGFRQGFRTHAGLLDLAMAKELARHQVHTAHVSFYSLRAEIHDAFTQRQGSRDATLAGMAALKAAGIAVYADIVVQAATVEEIPELYAYFRTLGYNVGFGLNIHRDHFGRAELDLLELTPVQRQRASELMARCIAEYTGGKGDLQSRADEGPCGAGRTAFYISPDGAVWPCVMFPMELGSLREHRLVDIWENSPQLKSLVAFKNKDRDTCLSCGGNSACFYCPGDAYKSTGDFRNPPKHFHERTRNDLIGIERARGATLTAADWDSIPGGGARPDRPGKFLFPIYRPQKGRGMRVGDLK